MYNDNDNDNINYKEHEITISVTQRNGRKMKTIVYGLHDKFDLKKIISHLRTTLKCSGAIKVDDKYGEIMIFTGDNKKAIYDFFIKEKIAKPDEINVKGI